VPHVIQKNDLFGDSFPALPTAFEASDLILETTPCFNGYEYGLQ
jgi:hypothetical protein